jgi:hypothetical protein
MKFHLIQSELSWKAGTKLWSNPGERSQGGAARDRREEASPRCLMGLHLGRNRGRDSPHRAKSVLSAPNWRVHTTAYSVTGWWAIQVQHAITSGKWYEHHTGEVPRRLLIRSEVTTGYKRETKGWSDASVAGTGFLWPRLQGYQQSQSSPLQGDERRNQTQFVNRTLAGTVSRSIAATSWPAGTSFQQLDHKSLRNIPKDKVQPHEPNRSN